MFPLEGEAQSGLSWHKWKKDPQALSTILCPEEIPRKLSNTINRMLLDHL